MARTTKPIGTAYNTYDQIKQAGGDGVFLSRGEHGCWRVHRLVRGTPVPTDPDAPWYHGRCKAFYDWLNNRDFTPTQRKAASLQTAQAWVQEQYGEAGPWVRNRMGDWLPARIHKAHPLRPAKKAEE